MPLRIAASLCALGLLAGLAATAHADPFVSGSLARTSTKFKNVKDGTGYSLAGGYSFDSLAFPIFVEASYYDSGTMKVKDMDVKLTYDGIQAFGGVAFKLGGSGSLVWFKGGYYSFDQKASGSVVSDSEKGSGATLGLGADWMFARSVGARFEIETPFKVNSFNSNGSGKTQLSIIKIGLVWRPRFSGNAPVADRSNDTAPAAAAPYSAPAPQVFAPTANGSSSLVRAGTAIRAQPKLGSPQQLAAADTMVTTDGSITNEGGAWWLVKGVGVDGWVLASDLRSP